MHSAWVNFCRDLIATVNGSAVAAARLEAAATGMAPFPGWEITTTGVAGILARAGDVEPAVRVMEARNRIGLIDTYDYLLYNPDLAPVRADPRFAALAAPARAGFDSMTAILHDAELLGELPAYISQPLSESRQRAAEGI
jgi:hypothetical protein